MVTLTTITHLCIVTKRLLVFDQPNERYPLNFFLAQSPLLIGDGDLFCLSSSLVLSLHIQDTIGILQCHFNLWGSPVSITKNTSVHKITCILSYSMSIINPSTNLRAGGMPERLNFRSSLQSFVRLLSHSNT